MNSFQQRKNLLLLAIVFPLVIAVVSLWQTSRTPSLAEIEQDGGQNQAVIAQLERLIEKQGPDATVELKDGKLIWASALIQQIRSEDDHFWTTATFRHDIPAALAMTGLCSALAATLLGTLGLWSIRRAGRRSLASRDALLSAFRSGSRRLPWLLAALLLTTVLALASLISFETVHYLPSLMNSHNGRKLALVGTLISVALVFQSLLLQWKIFKASRQVFAHRPISIMGKPLSQQEAPRLWDFVRDLAAKAKATMPDIIIVGLNEGFFVTEHPVELTDGKTLPRGRVLYLPLPFLAFMKKTEVAAVVGHELGHFVGADTEYSLHFSPIHASSVNNVATLHDNDIAQKNGFLVKPAVALGAYFLESFDLAIQHWSRKRELAADQFGSSLTSSETVASALLRTSVLAPRIDEALALCWNQGSRQGSGVLAQTRSLIEEKGLDDPRAHLEDKQAHPIDSHPTVFQRLEALGIEITETLLNQASDRQPCSTLQELGLEEAPADSAAAAADLPTSSVSRSLETEFSDAASEEFAQKRAFLEELASHGKEPLLCFERVLAGTLSLLLFAFGCAFTSYLLITHHSEKTLLLALSSIGSLFLFYAAARVFLRRKTPFLTLTELGVLFPGLQSELPWTAIGNFGLDISVQGLITTLTLKLDLLDSIAAPEFAKSRRAKYVRRKHQIVLNSNDFRRLKPKAFYEQFGTYWRGGLARAELSTIQV